MKKYFAIIALASLTLVACEKVQEFFDDSDDVTTIYAIAGANNTKTTVNGLNVLWSSGDVVAVANENDEIVEFTLKGGAGSNEASFEGTLGGKELGTYAVYPSTTNSAVSGTTVSVDYLDTWAYGKTEVPMWGKKVSEYSFYNVGGAVLVTYSNVPATTNGKHFVFTSNKNITGTVTVSNLGGTPAVSTPAGGNTVTITGIPSDATSVSVIVPVPAGTDYNITAALYEDSTDALVPGTLKAATGRTFKINNITKFDDVDLTPIITIETSSPIAVASTASTDNAITYNIANVAAGEEVTTSANVAWIENVTVVDETTVTFDVAQQPQGGAGRSGEITLSYNGASNVVVTVNQDPAPVINVSTTTPLYVKETGESSQSVSYTISYPTAGSALTAAESLDWVSTPVVGANAVTFTVTDQTHGANARYGIITLNYPNANPVSFYVSQEGKVYTLSGTTNNNTQSGVKDNGISWSGDVSVGNQWQITGTKNQTQTKEFHSTTEMPYNVTSVDFTMGGYNAVDSIESLVISAHSGSSTGTEVGSTSISGRNNIVNKTNTLTIGAGVDCTNKYYKFSFNSIYFKNNNYINFTSAVFYGFIVNFN
ncbi:MAG: hypothetical protein J6X57_07690 [Bacteroidales bacterium]|nr:hypothetical protein [Bacteroidales bacterium]